MWRTFSRRPHKAEFAAVSVYALHGFDKYRQARAIDIGHSGKIDDDAGPLLFDQRLDCSFIIGEECKSISPSGATTIGFGKWAFALRIWCRQKCVRQC